MDPCIQREKWDGEQKSTVKSDISQVKTFYYSGPNGKFERPGFLIPILI